MICETKRRFSLIISTSWLVVVGISWKLCEIDRTKPNQTKVNRWMEKYPDKSWKIYLHNLPICHTHIRASTTQYQSHLRRLVYFNIYRMDEPYKWHIIILFSRTCAQLLIYHQFSLIVSKFDYESIRYLSSIRY